MQIAKICPIKDRNAERQMYQNLGTASQRLGHYHDSIKYGKKGLKIAIDSDDADAQLQDRLLLGIAYRSLGNYQESITSYEKCLEIAMKLGHKRAQGMAYGNIGVVFKAQGKYHEAIECHTKLLHIAVETGDRQNEANAHDNLGIAYRLLGKYYQAIQYHEKTIAIYREIGDKKGEGFALGNLGNAFKALGKYREAMGYYQRGLSIAKELKSKDSEEIALGQLGNAYERLGEYHKAIECHQQCLKIAIEIGDKSGQGKAYENLGSCNSHLRNYEKAIEYHLKNFAIATQIGDRHGEMVCYGNLGIAYILLGMYPKAIVSINHSLLLAKEMDDRNGQAAASYQLGFCYYLLSYEQKDKGEDCLALSEQYLKDSLECYEWIFDHLQQQDHFKISIFDTFIHAYKLLTTVYMESQQNREALMTSERGRARALGDLLITKYNMGTAPRRGVLEYGDIERILSTPSSCILYFAITFHKECKQLIGRRGRRVVSWLMTSDNPPCLTLHSEIKDIEFPSPEQPADERVNKLVNQAFDELKVREAGESEDRSLEMSDTDHDVRCIAEDEEYDDSPLEILYNMLLSPVQDKLTHDEIVIIPDGPLFTVPYAALRNPQNNSYFSEHKRIRLAPSLMTLKLLKEPSADYHHTTGALIVGDPEVGKVMFRNRVKHFCRLPGAKREAELISEMLGVTAITGQQATKQSIMQRLREGVAVIHFAAHGSTEGEIALASDTSTDDGSIPQEDDYLLTIKEVQDIGIRPQLVVLSCCHSGRGEIKAEGVVGMSRAFLAAGARAVIGSLWAIADQATM
ncbi:hypothetical protein QZH41_012232, partial [Actinostola sp. cb2023]